MPNNEPLLLDEKLVGLNDLAKTLPSRRRSGPLSGAAIYRWYSKGIQKADGTIVRLEAVTVAGRLLSSEAALRRFIAAQQETPVVQPLPTPSRSLSKRQRAAEHADQILASAGI